MRIDFKKFAFQNFEINKYNCHFVCGDIKVYYSQNERTGLLSEKMGIFVQMTGEGCRQYEEYMNNNVNNWVALVNRFMQYRGNFTRIDIANGIYDNSLEVQQIYEYCKKGLCISASKKYEYHETGILVNGQRVGETVNIGAKGSDGQQLGIYNKLMVRREQGQSLQNKETWIRSELRLFGKRANEFVKIMATKKRLKDMTIEALEERRKHQKKLGRIDLIFSYNCLPITKTMLNKAISTHSKTAGVKSIRIHDLRHSHASLLLSLGMNDLELKNRLGHASIQTTLGVYSHLRPTAMKEVANRLEGTIVLE